jgi:chromosome partitioning protein
MKTIAFINQKGGVGKTTTTINTGAGLAQLGKKVLLVDMDPQAHLSAALGIVHHPDKTVYEVLKGELVVADAIIKRLNGLSVLPAAITLSVLERELAGKKWLEILLKEALKGLKGYEFILIDCPPSLGILTTNALMTAHAACIPVQTEYLALQGLTHVLTALEVAKRLNTPLALGGALCTHYDSRKILSRNTVQSIKDFFKEKVFKTFIRDNIALAEAPGYGQTIFEYRPHSTGAEDYLNLSREILKQD